MRYTTIIDIRELPAVYRNQHCRMLYLHLTLASGYHDDDRDQLRTSIRRIAADTGISVSAVRNALKQLEKYGLLTRNGETWSVKKFILEKSITPRIRSEKKRKEAEAAARAASIQEEQERREKEAKKKYLEERKNGRNPLKDMVKEIMLKAQQGDEEAARRLGMYKVIVDEIKREENEKK